MGRLRANLPSVAAAEATSYVIPNTRAVTDTFVLETATGDFYNNTDPLTVTDAVLTYPSISFADNLFIQINEEIFLVTDVTGDDVTFARAQLETFNTPHSASTDIYVEDYNDSTDNTAGGDFNNTTDPLELATAIADYPNVEFAVGAVLLIQSEKLLVTELDGLGGVTLARAQYGTTAATHANALDIYQLEWSDSTDDVAADVYSTVAADEYRIAPYTGYLIKRSEDDDGDAVDWSAIMERRFFWTGTLVTPSGQVGITREELSWFDESPPVGAMDADGALNLELAYQAIVDTLVAGGNAATANFEGVTIEVTGVATNQRAIKFKKNGVLVGIISAYKDDAGAHSLNIDTLSVQDEGSYADFSVDAPEGQTASVRMTLTKAGVTKGKFELIDDVSDVNYAYLSDVAGLMLNGSSAPDISDGFGVDIDGKILRLRQSKTPSSSSDTGYVGEFAWDADYFYICIAIDTWSRVAHSW